MLSDEELATAIRLIQKKPPGRYLLKVLLDDMWESNRRPRHYGYQFKRSVDRGLVPGIIWVRKRTNRSHEYEVMPGPW